MVPEKQLREKVPETWNRRESGALDKPHLQVHLLSHENLILMIDQAQYTIYVLDIRESHFVLVCNFQKFNENYDIIVSNLHLRYIQ